MKKIIPAFICIGLLSASCASIHSTSLRFDSPESQGKLFKSYLGTGAGNSRSYSVLGDVTVASPTQTTSILDGVSAMVFGGMGILERLDVELRVISHFAVESAVSPYVLRAKYQLLGQTRLQSEESFQQGFKLSALGGFGFNTMNRSSSALGINATVNALLLVGDFAVVTGYRFASWYMLYHSLAYTLSSLGGNVVQTGTITAQPTFNRLAHHVALSLGNQFDIKSFWIKLEGALNYGINREQTLFYPTFGVGLGLQF